MFVPTKEEICQDHINSYRLHKAAPPPAPETNNATLIPPTDQQGNPVPGAQPDHPSVLSISLPVSVATVAASSATIPVAVMDDITPRRPTQMANPGPALHCSFWAIATAATSPVDACLTLLTAALTPPSHHRHPGQSPADATRPPLMFFMDPQMRMESHHR
ncbi:hypothetical protein BJV77DRAFT_685518 [Russula vinacea]|jgi:hypothetical protein|nr:hypothetical protein BJV77DRAFT_685518 [Russula vinacea]